MADAKESKTFTITDESGESSVYEVDSFSEEQVNLWARIQQLTQERDQISLRGQEVNMLINQYGLSLKKSLDSDEADSEEGEKDADSGKADSKSSSK